MSDYLRGDGLTQGAHRLRARGQGCPYCRSSFRGHYGMTEITLTYGDAQATVALLGAEARQWRIAGRDLLWPGDPAIWSDISPILYPVVGWTRDGEERVDGVTYPLGLHGFARFQTFAIEKSTPDFARLTVRDNAETRAVYPFAFALAIEYRLTPDALAIAIEVANPGAKRAPYACGLHPGFRWPLGSAGREAHWLNSKGRSGPRFPSSRRAASSAGACVPFRFAAAICRLSDALFERDALCFLDCKSRSLSFIDASGASITMEYESFQHVGLWTGPHAPFICLEPWTSCSDPDGFTGDLFEKPGMRVLEPASTRATKRASSSGRSRARSADLRKDDL